MFTDESSLQSGFPARRYEAASHAERHGFARRSGGVEQVSSVRGAASLGSRIGPGGQRTGGGRRDERIGGVQMVASAVVDRSEPSGNRGRRGHRLRRGPRRDPRPVHQPLRPVRDSPHRPAQGNRDPGLPPRHRHPGPGHVESPRMGLPDLPRHRRRPARGPRGLSGSCWARSRPTGVGSPRP